METKNVIELEKLDMDTLKAEYLLTENQDFVLQHFEELFEAYDKTPEFFFALEGAFRVWLAGQTLIKR